MPAFFTDLAANQSRDWFAANRNRYDRDIATPLAQLVTSVSLALAVRDIPLTGTPKSSIFRINRDVRFSRDKSPYKTNAGAVLSRSGAKHSQGVLYIQIDAQGGALAAGFYMPEAAALAALRDAIVARSTAWRDVVARLAAARLDLSRDHIAARMPRGYDAAELADWLRLKSFTVSRRLSVNDVSDPGLVDAAAEFAADNLPLLQFGWHALADATDS